MRLLRTTICLKANEPSIEKPTSLSCLSRPTLTPAGRKAIEPDEVSRYYPGVHLCRTHNAPAQPPRAHIPGDCHPRTCRPATAAAGCSSDWPNLLPALSLIPARKPIVRPLGNTP